MFRYNGPKNAKTNVLGYWMHHSNTARVKIKYFNPVYAKYWPNAGLMSGCRRRWNVTLSQHWVNVSWECPYNILVSNKNHLILYLFRII